MALQTENRLRKLDVIYSEGIGSIGPWPKRGSYS